MRMQKAAVGLLLFGLMCVANTGQAQLLKRLFGNNTGQVSSSCPGGVCPTSAAPRSAPVAPVASLVQVPFKAVDNARGHYTYPGTIDNHLEYDHGVSTAGMTREQKLDLHDAIHRGEAHPINPTVSVPRAGYTAAPFVSHYPSYTARSGGGSTGGLSSVGSRSGGSTGDFAVGKFYKGELVTSIGEMTASSAPSAQSISPMRWRLRVGDRAAFRSKLLEQAKVGRDSGRLTALQYFVITSAADHPRLLDRMQEEAAVQSIDWDEIDWIALIERLIPLIMKLIELFGQVKLENATQYASTPQCSVLDSFHLAA